MRVVVLRPSHHPVAEPFVGGQERFTADLALADRLHVMPELPHLSSIASSDSNVPEELFLIDHLVYLAAVRDLLRRNDIDATLNESLVAS